MSIAEITIQKKTVTLVLVAALVIGGTVSFMGLGQLEDPGAVPVLEKHAVPSLFAKPRTDVRVAAYRALYHIGTPHAMKLLAKASSDKDSIVQSAVLGLRKSVDREG